MTPRLSILIFHRVLPFLDPLFPSEITQDRFDTLISFIANNFNVFTLGEAIERLNHNSLPEASLVITFDDGYADNAEVAYPILYKYGVSATFFVSSGFLDGGRMWNDTVIECIRRTSLQEIELTKLGLGVCQTNTPRARSQSISRILEKIKYMALSERVDILAHLEEITGNNPLPTNLMMRSDQVAEMHCRGIEIGGHTINHPILSKLNTKDAENEIAGGKNALEAIIGAPIQVFAYPNGKPDQDYSAEHARMVRNLGFRCAVTTAKGALKHGDSLFEIPRYTPWGNSLPIWSARLLKNQLLRHFDVATSTSSSGF